MNLSAFGAGAAEAGSEDIKKRRDIALELKLKSKFIELQGEQDVQQEQLKYNRERMSPEGTSAIGAIYSPVEGENIYKPGQQVSTAEAGLFKYPPRQGGVGGGMRTTGLDLSIGQTMSRILEQKYGIPAKQIENLPWRSVQHMVKGGSDGAIKEVADGLTSLEQMPEFYGQLKSQFGNNEMMDRAKRYVAQSDTRLRALMYPEIAQAETSFINLYTAALGGKNITANERKLARDMATSWAYGPQEMAKAEKAFRDNLINKVKLRVNSGNLGWAREGLIQQLNMSLARNGLEPVEIKAFDLDSKTQRVGDKDKEIQDRRQRILNRAAQFDKKVPR